MKKIKPITSSQRHTLLCSKESLYKGKSIKNLITYKYRQSKNNLGRVTVLNRCRGAKKMYRSINFKHFFKQNFQILRLEYDPNRSGYIMLIKKDKKLSYILAPEGIKINKMLYTSKVTKIGSRFKLKYIPTGVPIYNLELKTTKGGQISRSGGNSTTILSKDKDKIFLKMCSREIRIFNTFCYATIGIVSNAENKNIKNGKAGRMTWKGFKATVRGVAKNPFDHPHGGGEGKSGGGRHPVNRYGKLTKGKKTRRGNKSYKYN